MPVGRRAGSNTQGNKNFRSKRKKIYSSVGTEPTVKQIEYATSLGIKNASSFTKKQLSKKIDSKLNNKSKKTNSSKPKKPSKLAQSKREYYKNKYGKSK